MKSKIIALVSICLLALTLVVPALAGGWATITLDELPSGISAGEEFTVSFTVRQHGRTLMNDLAPTVSAQNKESGESYSWDATPVEGKPGKYEALVTFSSPGTWEWSIQAFTMDQRMPDLVISNGSTAPVMAAVKTSSLPLVIGIAGVLVAVAALIISLRYRQKWALVLIFLGLLVGGGGFVSAVSQGKNEAKTALTSQPPTLFETGQALFVAKGCLECHANNRIDQKYYSFRSDFGPNLTNYSNSVEFLESWLKDPASLRPNTEMPDLELKKVEIDALIAFLNGDSGEAALNPEPDQKIDQVVTATPNALQGPDLNPGGLSQPAEGDKCSQVDPAHSLLVSYSRDSSSYLVLIDPSTGNLLCNREQIDLGSSPAYAFTPDRSALAVISAVTPAQRKWKMDWIDLKTWKQANTGVVLNSWPMGISISPAETRAAVVYGRWTDDRDQKLLGHSLMQVDPFGKGDPLEVDMGISPRLVSYTGDGKSIMVYGVSYDYLNGTSSSNAKVKIFQSSDLSQTWEVELNDVLEGVYETDEAEADNPEQFIQWQPALVLSPDREKLYIVHADADKLTTVDLNARRVETVEILPQMSILERLFWLTSTPARAKVLNGTTKQAVLSPDGTHLYVSGFTGMPEKDQQGNWQFNILHFGLQVINLSDGSEAGRIKYDSNEVSLSQDGSALLLRGWDENTTWTDILDAKSLEVINHLDGQMLYPAKTLAGESLVVGSSAVQSDNSMYVYNLKTASPLSQINGGRYWLTAP